MTLHDYNVSGQTYFCTDERTLICLSAFLLFQDLRFDGNQLARVPTEVLAGPEALQNLQLQDNIIGEKRQRDRERERERELHLKVVRLGWMSIIPFAAASTVCMQASGLSEMQQNRKQCSFNLAVQPSSLDQTAAVAAKDSGEN